MYSVGGKGSGQTAAHWAAESGHQECLHVLAAFTPQSLLMHDDRRATPQEVAEKNAQPQTARFLQTIAQTDYVCVELSLAWSAEKGVTNTAAGASSSASAAAHAATQRDDNACSSRTTS